MHEGIGGSVCVLKKKEVCLCIGGGMAHFSVSLCARQKIDHMSLHSG